MSINIHNKHLTNDFIENSLSGKESTSSDETDLIFQISGQELMQYSKLSIHVTTHITVLPHQNKYKCIPISK